MSFPTSGKAPLKQNGDQIKDPCCGSLFSYQPLADAAPWLVIAQQVYYSSLVITCTAMARMNDLHPKWLIKNLALCSNIWKKVLHCTQTFEQKSCFIPTIVLQKSLFSSQTFWTKVLLCIQNVRKKSCFATKMVEQKSCFGPKIIEQKSLFALEILEQKSFFEPQTFEQKSCFAHNFLEFKLWFASKMC